MEVDPSIGNSGNLVPPDALVQVDQIQGNRHCTQSPDLHPVDQTGIPSSQSCHTHSVCVVVFVAGVVQDQVWVEDTLPRYTPIRLFLRKRELSYTLKQKCHTDKKLPQPLPEHKLAWQQAYRLHRLRVVRQAEALLESSGLQEFLFQTDLIMRRQNTRDIAKDHQHNDSDPSPGTYPKSDSSTLPGSDATPASRPIHVRCKSNES